MSECTRSDDGRFVCENHPDQPFFGKRACTCDGAGEPCPDYNASEVTAPELPDHLVDDRPIPRGVYIGERVGGPPMNEADNYIRCQACGSWIDCRDLGSVIDHEGPLPHPDRAH